MFEDPQKGPLTAKPVPQQVPAEAGVPKNVGEAYKDMKQLILKKETKQQQPTTPAIKDGQAKPVAESPAPSAPSYTESDYLDAGPYTVQLDKLAVNYQDKTSTGNQCSACTNYNQGGTCKVVKGRVSPTGTCRLWKGQDGIVVGKPDIKTGSDFYYKLAQNIEQRTPAQINKQLMRYAAEQVNDPKAKPPRWLPGSDRTADRAPKQSRKDVSTDRGTDKPEFAGFGRQDMPLNPMACCVDAGHVMIKRAQTNFYKELLTR